MRRSLASALVLCSIGCAVEDPGATVDGDAAVIDRVEAPRTARPPTRSRSPRRPRPNVPRAERLARRRARRRRRPARRRRRAEGCAGGHRCACAARRSERSSGQRVAGASRHGPLGAAPPRQRLHPLGDPRRRGRAPGLQRCRFGASGRALRRGEPRGLARRARPPHAQRHGEPRRHRPRRGDHPHPQHLHRDARDHPGPRHPRRRRPRGDGASPLARPASPVVQRAGAPRPARQRPAAAHGRRGGLVHGAHRPCARRHGARRRGGGTRTSSSCATHACT